MVFEICAGISTLVFIIIAIYLIRTLIALQQSLNQLTGLTSKLDTQIEPLAQETLKIMKNTNDMTEFVHDKLNAVNTLFDNLKEVSCAVKSSIHPVASEKKKQWQDIISDLIILAYVGIILWQKIKKGDE